MYQHGQRLGVHQRFGAFGRDHRHARFGQRFAEQEARENRRLGDLVGMEERRVSRRDRALEGEAPAAIRIAHVAHHANLRLASRGGRAHVIGDLHVTRPRRRRVTAASPSCAPAEMVTSTQLSLMTMGEITAPVPNSRSPSGNRLTSTMTRPDTRFTPRIGHLPRHPAQGSDGIARQSGRAGSAGIGVVHVEEGEGAVGLDPAGKVKIARGHDDQVPEQGSIGREGTGTVDRRVKPIVGADQFQGHAFRDQLGGRAGDKQLLGIEPVERAAARLVNGDAEAGVPVIGARHDGSHPRVELGLRDCGGGKRDTQGKTGEWFHGGGIGNGPVYRSPEKSRATRGQKRHLTTHLCQH